MPLKTWQFPGLFPVLRIGLGAYALLCARKATDPIMTAPSPTTTFVKDEDFTFPGEHLKDWFRFDRIVTRKSKRLFHKQGPRLWNNSAVEIVGSPPSYWPRSPSHQCELSSSMARSCTASTMITRFLFMSTVRPISYHSKLSSWNQRSDTKW